MPEETLRELTGGNPDAAKCRQAATAALKVGGRRPGKMLKNTLSTRNFSTWSTASIAVGAWRTY